MSESGYPTGDQCPVAKNCRNYPAACWHCTVPEEGRGPTEYVPVDKKVKHPATLAWEERRKAERKEKKQPEASKRSRKSRSRGRHGENVVAKELEGHRVPMSGALGGELSGDVQGMKALPEGWRVEVKTRARHAVYAFFEQGDLKPDVVALRTPHKRTLYVMDLEHLKALAAKSWWEGWRANTSGGIDLSKVERALALLQEALGGKEE